LPTTNNSYRLGKGVYLADMYQKSAGYCRGGYGALMMMMIMMMTTTRRRRE
jgi:hypothetical protein